MKFIGIIPARYSSTRFPGKPLVEIQGKIMIRRVYEGVSQVLDDVYVATDDERIKEAVENFGGKAIMTSYFHQSGTDRCREALEIIEKKSGKEFDAVINVQGDEPFVSPEHLELLMQAFDDPSVKIATLMKKITHLEELLNPNQPKVIRDKKGRALYFSRSTIPYVRKEEKNQWINVHDFYKHIGMYAYLGETLKRITMLETSPLELAESLEQNRWLENGIPIHVIETEHESIGIDTPDDLERIRNW